MTMDIVYSIDDNFIPQAAALTASILKHVTLSGAENRSGLFVFHFLSNGISEKNRLEMTQFIRERGGDAVFHDLGDFEGRLERILGAKPETGRFVKAALGRIFAAEYLPAEVKRYLYLDADMIARADIRSLLSMDLKGNIMAACAEPTIYKNLTVEQTRPEAKTGTGGGKAAGGFQAYYNTGLMLVDREAWDANETTKKCLTWYAEHNGTFDFADQDIINHVLAGKVLALSQRWNFQTNYHYQNYASLTRRAPWYGRLIAKEDYDASRRKPVIVHYAGDERPWIRGNKNPYRSDYTVNLAATPWKNAPQIKGRERYMLFYHTVNVMSERIPGFRAMVSDVYYRMKVKKK